MSGLQEEIFEETLGPVIGDVLAGFESTVFAYGQTGTGKTHTMEGDILDSENMGIIPRAAEAIFAKLQVRASAWVAHLPSVHSNSSALSHSGRGAGRKHYRIPGAGELPRDLQRGALGALPARPAAHLLRNHSDRSALSH